MAFITLFFSAITATYAFDPIFTVLSATIFSVSLLRFTKSLSWQKNEKIEIENITSEKNRFDFLVTLVSVSWALLFTRIWSLSEMNTGTLTIIQFSVCGLLGAASSSLGSSKRSYYLFIFPILASVSAHGFMYSTSTLDMVTQEILYVVFALFVIKVQMDQEKLWLENYSQKKELEIILQSFPFGISILDQGRYTYVNQNAAEQTGVLAHHFVGKKIGFLGPESAYSKLMREFIASSEDRHVGEISLFDQVSQSQRFYIIMLQKLSNAKRMICLTVDIDEKKKVEAELQRQTSKSLAAAKMASLGEMASGLAHEINNPLAIIAGISQQLLRIMASEKVENKKMASGLERIDRTTLRIASIIKGLRTFARDAESDAFTDVDINSLIEETLSFCRNKFARLGVDLQVSIPDKTLQLECRETEISQVILNLLNNAVDAVEHLSEKWVRIEAHLQKDTALQADYVEIAIIDSGSGVPLAIREKIMQPFFTTKEVGKGTGLGLSISIGIAKAHQGNLDIDPNNPNTKFFIRLPQRQSPKQKLAS